MAGGRIIGLDVGRLTGVASGTRRDAAPTSFTVILSGPRAGLAVQAGNLLAFLDQEFRREKPALLAKEAPIPLAAFRDKDAAAHTVRSAFALHGVVEAMCQRFSVPCHEVVESTVTKFFTGKGRWGGRRARKEAVMLRCRALGYVPADCRDEDRCDALAVWDWACAHLAKRAPRELVMFGERAPA